MTTHTLELEVSGPWSLAVSRAFWEGFAPAALPTTGGEALTTVFLVEARLVACGDGGGPGRCDGADRGDGRR